MAISALRQLLLELGAQVHVDHDQVVTSVAAAALIETLGGSSCNSDAQRLTIVASAALTRRGHELRLAYAPDDRQAPTNVDTKLIGLIAKAHAALTAGAALPKTSKDHLIRLAWLTTLAPDITSAILDGRQPVQLSARALLRTTELPIGWNEQRAALGVA